MQQRNTSMNYTDNPEEVAGDEIEDMYLLLKDVKAAYPDIAGVASGAIASNYQRIRVEKVAKRLGMTSLALLWGKD